MPTVPVLQPESTQAQAIFDLFLMVLSISGVIFALVIGLLFVAVMRGRKLADLPKQEFGSHRREIMWMVGPTLITFYLIVITAKLILTTSAYPAVHPSDGRRAADTELTVIGHQWWWEVQYNGSGLVEANEIHLPVDRKIRVMVTSADVIHCFWVPQLARKIDAIPGRENYIWLEANQTGVYQGRCAEYCGTQHAWMNFKVYVHTQEDYDRWLAGDREPAQTVTTDDALAGQQLFFDQTCVNCHAIDGTAATAVIGPNLTHLLDRQEIGGGVLKCTPENVARWLKNPQAFKPGCKMPNFNFTAPQVRQLVAYLESVN